MHSSDDANVTIAMSACNSTSSRPASADLLDNVLLFHQYAQGEADFDAHFYQT